MDDDMVLTPGGPRHKDFVNIIEPGHELHLLGTGEFVKREIATNNMTHFVKPPAGRAQYAVHGPHGGPTAQPAPAPGALPSGWQTYGWWDSGDTPITYFSTEWTVPPAPATSFGQTIFLFNGIQNTGTNYGILQPVLQWGVSAIGGGAYWAVASWYVASGGQAFHSNLVRVNSGTVLQGVMTQTGVSGANYSYDSTFQRIASTTLPVANIAPLHWANETLECYGLTQCSDLPATTDTPMSQIEIKIGTAHPALHWTAVNAITGCGQHTVIASNANPGGDVQLFYK